MARKPKFATHPAYTPLRLWGFWRSSGYGIASGNANWFMDQGNTDPEAQEANMYARMMNQAPEEHHERVNEAVEYLMNSKSGVAQQEGFVLKVYFADNARGDLDVTLMRTMFARKFGLKRVGESSFYNRMHGGVAYVGRYLGLSG